MKMTGYSFIALDKLVLTIQDVDLKCGWNFKTKTDSFTHNSSILKTNFYGYLVKNLKCVKQYDLIVVLSHLSWTGTQKQDVWIIAKSLPPHKTIIKHISQESENKI
jgi:hypothetical protein